MSGNDISSFRINHQATGLSAAGIGYGEYGKPSADCGLLFVGRREFPCRFLGGIHQATTFGYSAADN
jgi:hypothetical protein